MLVERLEDVAEKHKVEDEMRRGEEDKKEDSANAYDLEEEMLNVKTGEDFARETTEIRCMNALLEMQLEEAAEELEQNQRETQQLKNELNQKKEK